MKRNQSNLASFSETILGTSMELWCMEQNGVIVGEAGSEDLQVQVQENIKKNHFIACQMVKDSEPNTEVVSIAPNGERVIIEATKPRIVRQAPSVLREPPKRKARKPVRMAM